jgi:DNA-binding transcriptional MerR regulator
MDTTTSRQEPAPRFLSVGGAAAVIGVSPSTLQNWERRGVTPPAARLSGSNRRVYDVADMEALMTVAEERRRQRTAIAF